MDSLVDVLTDERSPESVALRAPGNPPAAYRRAQFVETVWRTGNYVRRLGAHGGATVAVVPAPSAAVPLSILGGALNGATVHVDPSSTVDAKLLVAPSDRIGDYDLPPGAQRVVHGGDVEDPAAHAFANVAGENGIFPQDRVFVDECALADRERRLEHRAIAERVAGVLDRGAIDPGDEVMVRAPLSDARTVVAGVFAPLAVGATISVADDGDRTSGDVAIVGQGSPESVPEKITIPVTSV